MSCADKRREKLTEDVSGMNTAQGKSCTWENASHKAGVDVLKWSDGDGELIRVQRNIY